jgi:hypothetical protein
MVMAAAQWPQMKAIATHQPQYDLVKVPCGSVSSGQMMIRTSDRPPPNM